MPSAVSQRTAVEARDMTMTQGWMGGEEVIKNFLPHWVYAFHMALLLLLALASRAGRASAAATVGL